MKENCVRRTGYLDSSGLDRGFFVASPPLDPVLEMVVRAERTDKWEESLHVLNLTTNS